jgi:hypothetical protein
MLAAGARDHHNVDDSPYTLKALLFKYITSFQVLVETSLCCKQRAAMMTRLLFVV